MQPNLPPELDDFSKGRIGQDLLKRDTDWLKIYRVSLSSGKCQDQTVPDPTSHLCASGLSLEEDHRSYRNALIDAIMAKIDIEYYRYSSGLQIGAGYMNLAADLATLGLNSAGAVVGNSELKTILAVAAAGTTGTTASIDKRLFLDQSRQAVVASMDAARAAEKLAVTTQEARDVRAYTLESALSDLQDYYVQGTVTSAFLTIQARAGQTKDDMKKKTVAQTGGKSGPLVAAPQHGEESDLNEPQTSNQPLSQIPSASSSPSETSGPQGHMTPSSPVPQAQISAKPPT